MTSGTRRTMRWPELPLGLIGVVLALLVAQAPLGFVAMLGILALVGMIARNSVILIDQIGTEVAAGHNPWRPW